MVKEPQYSHAHLLGIFKLLLTTPSIHQTHHIYPRFLSDMFPSPSNPPKPDSEPTQRSIPASYYRGGTSRGLLIHRSHLPPDPEKTWPLILGRIMGSPDPFGRQLNGMGTGLSSLSKICVISPSTHSNADVDYTFIQVGVKDGICDWAGNCGNMSSAVGPFCVDEGIVDVSSESEEASVIIFNTNTNKLIRSTFPVRNCETVFSGDLSIAGVAGTGAQVALSFLDPAGSRTGKLLPTGNVADTLDGMPASCVDAANPCVFVRAADIPLDITGTILPYEAEARPELWRKLEGIRQKASVAMGLSEKEGDAPESVPKLVMVSPPAPYKTLSGQAMSKSDVDLVVRSLSGLGFHRAVQITAALATASAAKVEGTVVADCVTKTPVDKDSITLGHPSGTLLVNSKVDVKGNVKEASVFRTARKLMKGEVFY